MEATVRPKPIKLIQKEKKKMNRHNIQKYIFAFRLVWCFKLCKCNIHLSIPKTANVLTQHLLRVITA